MSFVDPEELFNVNDSVASYHTPVSAPLNHLPPPSSDGLQFEVTVIEGPSIFPGGSVLLLQPDKRAMTDMNRIEADFMTVYIDEIKRSS